MQRSSEGCSIAQMGSAYLRRLQLSSEGAALLLGRSVAQVGCNVAQKGSEKFRGCSLAQRVPEGAA